MTRRSIARASLLALVASALLLVSPAGAATYEIKPGDTLSGIASRHGTSVSALVSINGLPNAHRIVAGRVLQIPTAGGAGGSAPAPRPTVVSGNRHVVLAGETLSGIAARYGLTASTLARWNGLTGSNRIYSGASLVLYQPNTTANVSITCPVPGGRFSNDWGFPRAGGRVHAGNDIYAPRGTAVRAPVAGTVRTQQGSIGGLQFRLTDAAGNEWVGTHLDRFGATGRVSAGTVIGYVGDTGNARGSNPHLHLEYHPGGGAPINPYPSLRAAC